MSDDYTDFFDKKRPWSKYKDLILDYYLTPYLPKVAKLGRPILIVDCFAGPGEFRDGETGSPSIIAKHLRHQMNRGTVVKGFFVERRVDWYHQLKKTVSRFQIPVEVRHGDFHTHLREIQKLASTHTVFIYLDPMRATHLKFGDLKATWDMIHQGQSVETLINLLSTGIMRLTQGLRARRQGVFNPHDKEVVQCNEIVGGSYWQEIANDSNSSPAEKGELIANGYAKNLTGWFKWVLKYPIRERYEDQLPKYHLVFGSRYTDAVDLMNRAMVKARREFVGAHFVHGMLFANQPKKEIIESKEIERLIVNTSSSLGKTTWKLLRITATINRPCMYTDAEFNRAIKKAIIDGVLKSDCDGLRITSDAQVWV